MTRLITAMTADQLRAQRERMAPSSSAVNRKPKRDRSRKAKAASVEYVPMQFFMMPAHCVGTCIHHGYYVYQLPIYTSGQRSWGIWHDRHSMVEAQVNATWSGLVMGFKSIDRSIIEHMELVRISPGTLDEHDNLPSAFKAIMDAVCSWIVEGDRVWDPSFDRRSIGKYDDKILMSRKNPNGRVTWGIDQMKHESRPCAYGIQIRLRLSQPA